MDSAGTVRASQVPIAPFRRVLVAVDFTDYARSAVARALIVAAEHGSELVAIHVAPRGMSADLRATAARRLAEELAALGAPAGAEALVVTGSVAATISAEAKERGADLIVLGRQGEHPMKDRFLGSTAESVVHNAPAPVLIVKTADPQPYANVVLAVDESKDAFHAARIGHALSPNAAHCLLHVAPVAGEGMLLYHGVNALGIDRLRAAHVAEATPKIEQLRSKFLPPLTTAVILPGAPQTKVAEIVTERQADLVVLGTRGTSRVRDFLVGSVAQNTMRRSYCDVLIVRSASGSADK